VRGERDSAPFVVTLGETMVALVAEEAGPLRYASRFQRRAAGAESNVAIGLTRLGVSAGWVSRVGDDEFGRYVCATVRGEGVDVSRVELDPERPTGIMIKELRAVGKSRVLYYRAGSAASALSPQTLPTAYLQRARHLHLTGITPALSPGCADAALAAARTVVAAGGTFSFDVNLRSQLSLKEPLAAFEPLIDLARFLFLGVDEAEQLFRTQDIETIERELTSLGVPTVILKLGANGARTYTSAESRWVTAPGYRVPVVDEVGAGDAFAAAYLAAAFREAPVEDALRIANAAGALATTVPGDIEGFAGWDELEQFTLRSEGTVQR
jgi:2-dehydro-3-deoxygluconokinase